MTILFARGICPQELPGTLLFDRNCPTSGMGDPALSLGRDSFSPLSPDAAEHWSLSTWPQHTVLCCKSSSTNYGRWECNTLTKHSLLKQIYAICTWLNWSLKDPEPGMLKVFIGSIWERNIWAAIAEQKGWDGKEHSAHRQRAVCQGKVIFFLWALTSVEIFFKTKSPSLSLKQQLEVQPSAAVL